MPEGNLGREDRRQAFGRRKLARARLAPALIGAGLLACAGCTTFPDTPVTTNGGVTLRTYGDLATATSRARLACGEPKRTPVLMSVDGSGEDQTATFGCL